MMGGNQGPNNFTISARSSDGVWSNLETTGVLSGGVTTISSGQHYEPSSITLRCDGITIDNSDYGYGIDDRLKEYFGTYKEESKMIESIEIVKLYRTNREAAINAKYNKKIEELKSSNTLVKEYEELVNSFKASVEQLYTSQFEEGETESTIDRDLVLRNNGNSLMPLTVNTFFRPEGMKELEDAMKEELAELSELCAKVTATLKICKTKTEVEEELIKYGIYNKKDKTINLIEIVK